MNDILKKIVQTKWEEIKELKKGCCFEELEDQLSSAPCVRDFAGALSGGAPIRLIAEVKKASPSAGIIRKDFDPVEIAKTYENAGASCLSVLTDQKYFQGNLDYLKQIRSEVELPILRKDFIVDRYQIAEARLAGADAVLLIAECLENQELNDLYNYARHLGLAVLIELHDPANLPKVLQTGTQIVGVNNRDLTDFSVDTNRTLQIRKEVPEDRLLIGESGVHDRKLVQKWEKAGVNGMLVGQSLMQQPDIFAATADLLGR